MSSRDRRVYRRLERVAGQLQADAYAYQTRQTNKQPKRFNPCPRGLFVTEQMGRISRGEHVLLWPTLQLASCVGCQCHTSRLTASDLFDMGVEPC